MVAIIKEGWAKWLISGIPVALVLLGLVFTSGARLNSIDNRLSSLEKMDNRIGSLELQVNSLQLQVQELKDELRYEKKITAYPEQKERYNRKQDVPSDQAFDN